MIDDPITSLDEHRSLTTVQEMRRLAGAVDQVIIMSHSKPFLCALWKGSDAAARSALKIARDGAGSTLAAGTCPKTASQNMTAGIVWSELSRYQQCRRRADGGGSITPDA